MSGRERSWCEDRFQAVLGLRVSGLGERLQPTPPSHRPSSSNPTPDLPEHAEARNLQNVTKVFFLLSAIDTLALLRDLGAS